MGVVTLMSDMKLKIDIDVYKKSGGQENGLKHEYFQIFANISYWMSMNNNEYYISYQFGLPASLNETTEKYVNFKSLQYL